MIKFTYYGYGSNMLQQRLQKRCKSARFVGVAILHRYALEFSKKSRDGSGKATITKSITTGATLYGSLYEIDLAERHELDRCEGSDYERKDEFKVWRVDNNEEVSVSTYIANQSAISHGLAPYDWYKALVIAGARQCKLPTSYIAELEAIPSIIDNKLSRGSRVEALAALEESGLAI